MKARAATAWLAVVVLGAALLGVTHSAEAATTRTWTGNGATSNWTDAGNWSPGLPVAGDDLVFPAVANRKSNNNNFAANTAFASITLDGSGYNLHGNAINLTNDLLNQSSGDNEVVLQINGPGGISQQTGRLILSGPNAFDGGVQVVAGALRVEDDSALGSTLGQTVVNDPGTLEIAGGVDLGDEIVTAGGFGYDEKGAVQSLTGTNVIGRLKLVENTRVGVFSSTLIVNELSQTLSGGLELVGGGKLQVEFSFFAGALDVTAGNLTWNATSQAFVSVASHGTLRGTEMVSQVDVFGGRVWPGSGNAPGTLSVFNSTVFNAGSFRVDIEGPGPAEYGQLVTNGLSLNPAATVLELDISVDPSTGDVYRIIDNTSVAPVSGTFLDLPEGATFVDGGYVWKISYKGGTGNDVTLTVLRVASADLNLQMTGSPSPVAPGGNLTFTVVVRNDGPDDATSPTVSLGTPVGTTFVSSTQPANWTCSIPAPGPTVRCVGPKMAAGSSVTLTLTFKLNAGTAGSVVATAGVSSDTNDPASADNSSTVTTPIGAADGRPFKRFVVGIARD